MIDTRFQGDDRPFAERWTQRFMVDLATEWQGVLRLADWDIDVSILGVDSLGLSFGVCRTVLEQKQYAHVELLDPADYEYDGDDIERYDPEVTIVHELLHVFTARILAQPTKRGTKHDIVAEQLAHQVSRTLVKQKRALLAATTTAPTVA